MLHKIPELIATRMGQLEEADKKDRDDGTPRLKRLRQIPPETGQFLALMLRMAPDGPILEIGTSAGYSTLWMVLACQQSGGQITTFEILAEKAQLARKTFEETRTTHIVNLIEDDARKFLADYQDIAFCFLDAEKEIYSECYDLVIPRMKPGGILIADNAINHADTLQPMLDAALVDPRVDAMVVPIGKGVLFCRRKGLNHLSD